MRINSIAAIAMLLVLAACGGGGPDAGVSDFPPDPPSTGNGGSSGGATSGATSPGGAQGFYTGSTSNGYAFNSVILETGEFWGVYGRSGVVYGAVHGSSRASASAFTGAGFDYYLPSGTRTSSTFNGTYSPKRQMAGTVSSTGGSFTGTYDASYDMPATAAALVGTWTGTVVSQAGVQSASVTIDSAGRFQGAVTTCAYSGTAQPRPSGKAVYDTAITFAGTGCLFNGQTLRGISVLQASGGAPTLITAALLADGTAGFLSAGTR